MKDSGIRELSQKEAWSLLDEAAQFYLGIPAEKFIYAYRHGEFDSRPETREVMAVTMLLPLVGVNSEWPEEHPPKR